MRVLIAVLASLAIVSSAHASRGDPKADARRHVTHADKAVKAGDTAVAIDRYWEALGAAARIRDPEERYATANVIRLRIAETELAAHRVDGDPRHLDAAQAVLDEYVKVHNPADPKRAQALYDELDRRRHPPPAPTPAAQAPPPRPVAPLEIPPRPSTVARPMLIAGATLTAAGGVAAIGLIAALVVHNDADDDVDAASTIDERDDAEQRRASARAGAIASGVLAAAMLGAGVPLLVISLQKRRAARVIASPGLGPAGPAFALHGRF
jgi:hypothetical protein